MYCLDTNIVIDIFRGDEKLKEKVNNIGEDKQVFISIIALCELYKGAYSFFDPERKIKDVEDFISNFQVIGLDSGSCKEYGKIYYQLKKKGNLSNDFDLIIASIAKSNNLILVTRDKHFGNMDIKVEVW